MADQTFHKLDPDGDFLLVLRNPSAPFAVWNEPETAGGNGKHAWNFNPVKYFKQPAPLAHPSGEASVWDDFDEVKKKKKVKKEKKKGKKAKISNSVHIEDPDIVPEPSAEEEPVDSDPCGWCPPERRGNISTEPISEPGPSTLPATTTPNGSKLDSLQDWQEPDAAEVEQTMHPPNGDADEGPTIKFLLSSQHLVLASSYFRSTLKGQWKEAQVQHSDGYYHMETEDWDPQALLYLMRIIHGKHAVGLVPRAVDLEMLAKIAVLVDYYGCHEVVEVFSTMWIDLLEESLPSECDRSLVLWLLVSIVFRKENVFKKITETVILQSKKPLPTLGLPVPASVIDTMDLRRREGIEFILNELQKVATSLCMGTVGCDFQCSAFLLGVLTKEMYVHILSNPSPCQPYLGHGLLGVENTVLNFRSPTWRLTNTITYPHPCSLTKLISNIFTVEFHNKKEGLSLADL